MKKIIKFNVIVTAIVTLFSLSLLTINTVRAQSTSRGLILNINTQSENIKLNGNTVFAKTNREQIDLFTVEIVNDYEDQREISVIPTIENMNIDNSVPLVDTKTRSINDNSKEWLVLDTPKDEPINLKRNESKVLTATFKIPEGARPGTHQIMLNFPMTMETNGDAENAVGLDGYPRILVFFTVDGDFIFSPDIKEVFTANSEGVKKTEFRSGEKAFVHVILSNSGNIYYRPYGDIFLYKDVSNPSQTIKFNPNDSIVPHENTREFVYELKTGTFYNPEGTNFFNQYNWGNFFDFNSGNFTVSYNGIFNPAQEVDLALLDEPTKSASKSSEITVVADQIKIIIAVIVAIVTLVSLVFLVKKLTAQNNVKL